MKHVGYINGISVYEDPNCPPGMLYALSDAYEGQFVQHSTLSRFGLIKARLKRWIERHRHAHKTA